MSTITGTVDRRFPVERICWTTLEGRLRLASFVATLVHSGGSALFFGALMADAFNPFSGWGDLLLVLVCVAAGCLGFRNAIYSDPHFVTRGYLLADDSLQIENRWRSISVLYENIERIEPIQFGWPPTPLRSALRIHFHRPIGFRLSIDVFPARAKEFFDALAARCPKAGVSTFAPEAINDPDSIRFAMERDRWDLLNFYIPLAFQAAFFSILGVLPFPLMLWSIGRQLPGTTAASSWETAILVFIVVCLALQMVVVALSLVRRVRFALVRGYVFTDHELVLDSRDASGRIPWSQIYRIQPSKMVRLCGMSLKPAYRIRWRPVEGGTSSLDVCPLDVDGFLEAVAGRCPHIEEGADRWRSADSRSIATAPEREVSHERDRT